VNSSSRSLTALMLAVSLTICIPEAAQARYKPGEINPKPIPLKADEETYTRGIESPSGKGAIAPASAGLSWQTALVEGAADFLVERAQGELLALVMTRLSREFCRITRQKEEQPSTWPEERNLFPQTCQLLETYRADSTRLFGSLITSAIRADLERLPVMLLPDNQARLVDALYTIARGSRQGQSPLELIAGLSEVEVLKTACSKGQPPSSASSLESFDCDLLLTAQLTEKLLIVNDESGYQTLLRDQRKRDMLLCGLAEVVTGFGPSTHESRAQFCAGGTWPKNHEKFKAQLWSLVSRLRVLHERVSAVEQQVAFRVRIQEPLEDANHPNGAAMPSGPPSPGDAANPGQQPASSQARPVSEDYFSYRTAPFSAASSLEPVQRARLVLLGIVDIFRAGSDIYRTKFKDGQDRHEWGFEMAEAVADTMVGSYDEGIRKALVVLAGCPTATFKECEPPPSALKYLPLMVSLAGARTSTDIKLALESAAAPIGSWALKRERSLWSITGWVGAQGAVEFGPVPSGVGLGPTGILGLEWTTPRNDGWDAGVMFSVVDLGQLVYPRLSATEGIRENSKPSVIQVLSPGVYGRLGYPDTPFTLGAGFSLAPRLRCAIDDVGGCKPNSGINALRFGLLVAVDVTILNLSE
jgi:hypothetical protein